MTLMVLVVPWDMLLPLSCVLMCAHSPLQLCIPVLNGKAACMKAAELKSPVVEVGSFQCCWMQRVCEQQTVRVMLICSAGCFVRFLYVVSLQWPTVCKIGRAWTSSQKIAWLQKH